MYKQREDMYRFDFHMMYFILRFSDLAWMINFDWWMFVTKKNI